MYSLRTEYWGSCSHPDNFKFTKLLLTSPKNCTLYAGMLKLLLGHQKTEKCKMMKKRVTDYRIFC